MPAALALEQGQSAGLNGIVLPMSAPRAAEALRPFQAEQKIKTFLLGRKKRSELLDPNIHAAAPKTRTNVLTMHLPQGTG